MGTISSTRTGSGRYEISRGDAVFTVERMGANSVNKGLWETRRRGGPIIAVDARKRDALRCIEDGLY